MSEKSRVRGDCEICGELRIELNQIKLNKGENGGFVCEKKGKKSPKG